MTFSCFSHFPISCSWSGVILIVSIPDICLLPYFLYLHEYQLTKNTVYCAILSDQIVVGCQLGVPISYYFNMSCKPTNTATRIFNRFLGPPVRHLKLQYVPSTTYTVTHLNNTPTTASIATHTFSSSIGPPTPPLRPSVRFWDHQH